MGIEMNNFKEKIKEFFENIKKDKKKMFFVVLIPLILIGSIIAGILLNNEDTEKTMEAKEKALIVPVDDNVELEKSKKSDMYKKDFFDLNDKSNDLDDSFSDSTGNDLKGSNANKIKVASTNQNKSYYKASSSSSIIKRNIDEINRSDDQNVSSDVSRNTTKEEKGKRSRVPSDDTGNLTFGNKRSSYNYRGVVANGNRTVKVGSYVKIRIAEDINVDGLTLTKNSVVSGLAGISEERLSINITSVKIGNVTKSVDWNVYDEDGNFGVAIPRNIIDAIAADVSEDAIEDGGTKIEGNVPVVGSVKINLKRKAKMVEFIIPDGHRILIKKSK